MALITTHSPLRRAATRPRAAAASGHRRPIDPKERVAHRAAQEKSVIVRVLRSGGPLGGKECSCKRPKLVPCQRRPTAADVSGSYSGQGLRTKRSCRPGEKRSDQSRVTVPSKPRELRLLVELAVEIWRIMFLSTLLTVCGSTARSH